MTVFRIGRSTRPGELFLALLELHRIAVIVDVRTLPGSHRAPQFNQEALERTTV